MITDEIMEVLSILGELLGAKECSLVECIKELLSDFDEYVWDGMGEQERRNWIEEYIKF